jgi:hypothetical protein
MDVSRSVRCAVDNALLDFKARLGALERGGLPLSAVDGIAATSARTPIFHVFGSLGGADEQQRPQPRQRQEGDSQGPHHAHQQQLAAKQPQHTAPPVRSSSAAMSSSAIPTAPPLITTLPPPPSSERRPPTTTVVVVQRPNGKAEGSRRSSRSSSVTLIPAAAPMGGPNSYHAPAAAAASTTSSRLQQATQRSGAHSASGPFQPQRQQQQQQAPSAAPSQAQHHVDPESNFGRTTGPLPQQTQAAGSSASLLAAVAPPVSYHHPAGTRSALPAASTAAARHHYAPSIVQVEFDHLARSLQQNPSADLDATREDDDGDRQQQKQRLAAAALATPRPDISPSRVTRSTAEVNYDDVLRAHRTAGATVGAGASDHHVDLMDEVVRKAVVDQAMREHYYVVAPPPPTDEFLRAVRELAAARSSTADERSRYAAAAAGGGIAVSPIVPASAGSPQEGGEGQNHNGGIDATTAAANNQRHHTTDHDAAPAPLTDAPVPSAPHTTHAATTVPPQQQQSAGKGAAQQQAQAPTPSLRPPTHLMLTTSRTAGGVNQASNGEAALNGAGPKTVRTGRAVVALRPRKRPIAVPTSEPEGTGKVIDVAAALACIEAPNFTSETLEALWTLATEAYGGLSAANRSAPKSSLACRVPNAVFPPLLENVPKYASVASVLESVSKLVTSARSYQAGRSRSADSAGRRRSRSAGDVKLLRDRPPVAPNRTSPSRHRIAPLAGQLR